MCSTDMQLQVLALGAGFTFLHVCIVNEICIVLTACRVCFVTGALASMLMFVLKVSVVPKHEFFNSTSQCMHTCWAKVLPGADIKAKTGSSCELL